MNQPSAEPRTGPGRRKHSRGGMLVKAVIALVALGAIGAIVLAVSQTDRKHTDRADTFTVQVTSFDVLTTANGELQSRNKTDITSQLEIQSPIVEIVPEGKFVKKGDFLVRLNSEEIEKQLTEAENKVRLATNELAAAEADYAIQVSDNDSAMRAATLALELAELELRKWRQGDVVEKRLQLSQELERAEAEAGRLQRKVERSRKLFAKEFISSDEMEADERDAKEAIKKLEVARIAVQTYEEFTYHKEEKELTSKVEEARAEIERVKTKNASQLSSRLSDLEYKKANLRESEDERDRIKKQVESATIYAPTDGLVVYASSLDQEFMWDSRGPIAVGREVWPNETIIVLPDTSDMVAAIKVHESLIGKIKVGQRAHVKIDAAQGKTFEGTVDSIGILAESGGWRDPNLREYLVKISLNAADSVTALKPSMRCEGQIILDRVENALAVPIEAVFSEGAVTYVYTSTGAPAGRYIRVPVEIKRRSDTFAEVASGITEGARVLLREPNAGEVHNVADDAVARAVALAQANNRKPGGPGGAAPMDGAGERRGPGRRGADRAPVEGAAPAVTETEAEGGASIEAADSAAESKPADETDAAHPGTASPVAPALPAGSKTG